MTPIHEWHVAPARVRTSGSRSAAYFPAEPGEDLDAAVARECLAVRHGVGVIDASTLGEIEVAGPTAAFLDRMYTNRMSTLAVDSIRYGLMCGVDGMVDGRRRRDAPGRGPVPRHDHDRRRAAVLDHFEECTLQTEWTTSAVLHERHGRWRPSP